MIKNLILIILIYFIVINITSAIVTVLDKFKAKHGKWRIPEKTLFILSAIGGAVGMYITMHLIHHKTKKMKFMRSCYTMRFSRIASIEQVLITYMTLCLYYIKTDTHTLSRRLQKSSPTLPSICK